jgi:hypothetical protein
MAKMITRRSLILAAPALILPVQRVLDFRVVRCASPFVMQITYSPQALAAPQSFRDNVETAANFYRACIFNPITVSFNVGYDEIWDGGYSPSPSNESQTIIWQEVNNISYTTIRAALALLLVNSAVQTSFLSSLPVASSIGGVTNWSIMSSAAKMLNLWPAGQRNVADYDSTIGIGSAINPASVISTIIHEFGHALGRVKSGTGMPPMGSPD